MNDTATPAPQVQQGSKKSGKAGARATRKKSEGSFVLAGDIGYSGTKIAYGRVGSSPESMIRPANAGPLQSMPMSIAGVRDTTGEVARVMLGNEPWVAFVPPGVLQFVERQLHEDYPFTKEYLALYYGILALPGLDVIDRFVTGLPVNQAMNNDTVESLKERLIGEHRIAKSRTVVVNEVTIVAQPVGTYLSAIQFLKDDPEMLNIMAHGRVAVVDPGMYSTDWVLIQQNQVRTASSGTSQQAMSVIYEGVHSRIADEYGVGPGPQRIERAIQEGQDAVMSNGKMIELGDILQEVADPVADLAMTSMRKAMRVDTDGGIDLVILTGGGAPLFKAAVERAFPGPKIWISKDPQMANVMGYWTHGCNVS